MIKKIALIVLIFTVFVQPGQVLAQSRLDILKKEIASQAAKLRSVMDEKLQNKFYKGTITQVDSSANKIMISNDDTLSTILVNEYTNYDNKLSPKQNSFKSLQKDQFIVALGDLDDNGQLLARKIVVTTPPTFKLSVYSGSIESIDSQQFVVKTADNQLVTVHFAPTTTVLMKDKKEATSSLEIRKKVLVTTTDSDMVARTVYVTPTPAVWGKPKFKMTGSPTPAPVKR